MVDGANAADGAGGDGRVQKIAEERLRPKGGNGIGRLGSPDHDSDAIALRAENLNEPATDEAGPTGDQDWAVHIRRSQLAIGGADRNLSSRHEINGDSRDTLWI